MNILVLLFVALFTLSMSSGKPAVKVLKANSWSPEKFENLALRVFWMTGLEHGAVIRINEPELITPERQDNDEFQIVKTVYFKLSDDPSSPAILPPEFLRPSRVSPNPRIIDAQDVSEVVIKPSKLKVSRLSQVISIGVKFPVDFAGGKFALGLEIDYKGRVFRYFANNTFISVGKNEYLDIVHPTIYQDNRNALYDPVAATLNVANKYAASRSSSMPVSSSGGDEHAQLTRAFSGFQHLSTREKNMIITEVNQANLLVKRLNIDHKQRRPFLIKQLWNAEGVTNHDRDNFMEKVVPYLEGKDRAVPDDCAICMDSLVDGSDEKIALTNCEHAFHDRCLQIAAQVRQQHCPMCRTPLAGPRGNLFDDQEDFSFVRRPSINSMADLHEEFRRPRLPLNNQRPFDPQTFVRHMSTGAESSPYYDNRRKPTPSFMFNNDDSFELNHEDSWPLETGDDSWGPTGAAKDDEWGTPDDSWGTAAWPDSPNGPAR